MNGSAAPAAIRISAMIRSHSRSRAIRSAVRQRGEATERRIDGVGTRGDAFDEICAADKIGDEGIGRPVVDLLRRRHLHQPSVTQHGNPIGQR